MRRRASRHFRIASQVFMPVCAPWANHVAGGWTKGQRTRRQRAAHDIQPPRAAADFEQITILFHAHHRRLRRCLPAVSAVVTVIGLPRSGFQST